MKTCPIDRCVCKKNCALFGERKCLIAEFLENRINPFRNLISVGELPTPREESNNE